MAIKMLDLDQVGDIFSEGEVINKETIGNSIISEIILRNSRITVINTPTESYTITADDCHVFGGI